MAGAGAGGGNNPSQDKIGFFSSIQPFTFNEEHLAAKVEEERRLNEWREGEGRESAHNTLWSQFQQTAAALTQLYRQDAAGAGAREWQPFQVAAGQLTMLYRDSLEEMRKASELSKRSGYQKSRSDLVSWIRGRRGRNISRCELLAFLTRDLDLDTRDTRGPETRDLSLPPASDPATQHVLLQMFENNRLNGDEGGGGGRKRGVTDPDNEESEMESPQSKRSRFL